MNKLKELILKVKQLIINWFERRKNVLAIAFICVALATFFKILFIL